MRKSWFLRVGLLGLCIAGAIGCAAQEAPKPPRKQDAKAQPAEVIGPPAKDEAPQPPKQDGKQETPPKGKQKHPPVAKNVGNNSYPPSPPVVVWEDTAKGYGVIGMEPPEDATNDVLAKAYDDAVAVALKDANEDAVKDACDKVSKRLAKDYGDNYSPKPEDLKRRGIVGEATYFVKKMKIIGATEVATEVAMVPVKVTDDDVKYFQVKAREERSGGRMKIAGMTLAGFVALLLVGGGYLRLEEATKGYYTTLLRATALGIIGLVVGALLLLW